METRIACPLSKVRHVFSGQQYWIDSKVIIILIYINLSPGLTRQMSYLLKTIVQMAVVFQTYLVL